MGGTPGGPGRVEGAVGEFDGPGGEAGEQVAGVVLVEPDGDAVGPCRLQRAVPERGEVDGAEEEHVEVVGEEAPLTEAVPKGPFGAAAGTREVPGDPRARGAERLAGRVAGRGTRRSTWQAEHSPRVRTAVAKHVTHTAPSGKRVSIF